MCEGERGGKGEKWIILAIIVNGGLGVKFNTSYYTISLWCNILEPCKCNITTSNAPQGLSEPAIIFGMMQE